MSIVIVGHGSIGSKFNTELKKRGIPSKSIFIIDQNNDLLNILKKDGHPCFNSIQNLEEYSESINYGIIANWGPDHINSANELLKLGCKRLIIEKPVSSKIQEVDEFEKIIKEKFIFATVHHHWKYLNLIELIKTAELKYQLSSPVGVRLIGGALCLSTNGVHWCDFALEVLDSCPESIMADLDIDYINPRDKSLAFIGGMCSYKMANGSFIHVSYTNQNSQSARAEVVYRHGLIEICIKGKEGKLKIYKRKEEDIERFSDKITRHGHLDFVGEMEFVNKPTVPNVLDDLLEGEVPKVSVERAKISLKMIIGAIQSNKENSRVQWNKIKDQNIRIS